MALAERAQNWIAAGQERQARKDLERIAEIRHEGLPRAASAADAPNARRETRNETAELESACTHAVFRLSSDAGAEGLGTPGLRVWRPPLYQLSYAPGLADCSLADSAKLVPREAAAGAWRAPFLLASLRGR